MEIHVRLNSIGYSCGTEWDDGDHERIDKIIVGTRSSIISSIRFVYKDQDGTKVLGQQHGGSSSSFKVITVNKPITRIMGTYGYSSFVSTHAITYLEFSNGKELFCSFGKKHEVGSSFTFESDTGFTGFHGRSGSGFGITALGVYVNSSATRSLTPAKN